MESMVWLVWQIGFGFIMPENTWKYDFGNFSLKKRSLTILECRFLRNFRLSLLRFKKNCDVMEQFWRQIRIQRAKIHKTSLVRSPAQGTFFFVGLCYRLPSLTRSEYRRLFLQFYHLTCAILQCYFPFVLSLYLYLFILEFFFYMFY